MEATIVCIDNSEWTRSGDYAPTRFQAQADAVNLLAGAKTQANPENTVGVLTMAGKNPRVLVTPTPDLGKVLNCMTDIVIEGEANITSSVQIAQLALKHRQNKNQRQRIVIFAGSPVQEDKVSWTMGHGLGIRHARRAAPWGTVVPCLLHMLQQQCASAVHAALQQLMMTHCSKSSWIKTEGFSACRLLVKLLACASSRQSVGVGSVSAMHVPDSLSKDSS
jgi:hypothetical protein